MRLPLIVGILILLSCSVQGQDFSIIASVTEKKPTFPEISFSEKKEAVKEVKIPSKSKPSFDLLGSIRDAYNKDKLVKHLYSHDNHKGKWDKEFLESLSIGQLWWLHDDDHEKQEKLKAVEVDPCPGGI